jgi:hypothetical protein
MISAVSNERTLRRRFLLKCLLLKCLPKAGLLLLDQEEYSRAVAPRLNAEYSDVADGNLRQAAGRVAACDCIQCWIRRSSHRVANVKPDIEKEYS